jgi:surface antigen
MKPLGLAGCALALLLGACAAPGPDDAAADPGLYGRLSDRDVVLAAALLQEALETAPDGTARAWANPATGHGGRVTPMRSYLSEGGYFCRDYQEELAVGGRTGRFEHAACRDQAGLWIWL